MIGQNSLYKMMSMQMNENTFPKFCILSGEDGSGKHTLVSKFLNDDCAYYSHYIVQDVKVESIRTMIRDAYKIQTPTIFVIYDADNMSINAKNALLKVTEEPPHKAKFIMTVSNLSNVLDTLKSRATVYYMERYTPNELIEFATQKGLGQFKDVVSDICDTPGDIERLSKYDVAEFISYVDKVIDNIATVSLANAFKIPQQLNFTDDSEKYDVDLFLRVFKMRCGMHMKKAISKRNVDEQIRYAGAISIINTCLTKMKIVGISKQALFDMLILDLRREWE